MKRFAIYARYSDDGQSPRSIDDQLRLCREAVGRLGGDVVAEFTDPAVSAAALVTRPGALAMLAGAKAGRFDAVFVESQCRLSRSLRDIADIHMRLEAARIKLITSEEGEINELHIGFKGTMNAMFLKGLAAKLRRGQAGRTHDGIVTCGLAYGYRVAPRVDDAGRVSVGYRAVVDEHARVIRRIFEEYAAGKNPRAIAHRLNVDGIPAPRGGAWRGNAITGHRARRNGILWNEAYIGFLIWNRQSFHKDPDSGRRLGRPNPPEQWVVKEVPELRIVDHELWDRAHAVLATYGRREGLGIVKRPKRLIAGLVRCAACGGPYTIMSGTRMVCTRHRESGVCGNGRVVRADILEAEVLRALRDDLLAPDMIAAAAEAYRDERNRLTREAAARADDTGRQLAEVKTAIRRLLAIAESGVESPDLAARLKELEQRRKWLEADNARGRRGVVDLHPKAIAEMQRLVDELVAIGDDDGLAASERGLATNGVRGLIDRIDIEPGEKRGDFAATLHGQLAPLFLAGLERTGTAGLLKSEMDGSGGPLPSKTYIVAIPLQLGRKAG
jgi:site-specific DNA recombinase